MGRPKKVNETVEQGSEESKTVESPLPETEHAKEPIAEEKAEASTVQLPNPKQEYIFVNAYLFHKMFSTCVHGQSYSGHSAVVKFGQMLGANTYDLQKNEWKKCQEFLQRVK